MWVNEFIKKGCRAVGELVFPPVCLKCGANRTLQHQYLCPFCLDKGFEEANPGNRRNASREILPQHVHFQDALWKYQKGSTLQHLMYHLKYDFKANLGKQLGILAADRARKRPFVQSWLNNGPGAVILPVPLHPTKMRLRGFNQARRIAMGMAEVLNIEVVNHKSITRVKKTGTQTGFSFQSRLKNMQGAFKVVNRQLVAHTRQLIVDDVFTTGSTVFELANELKLNKSKDIGILTVAQA